MPTDAFTSMGWGGDITEGNNQTANALDKAGKATYNEAQRGMDMATASEADINAKAALQPGEIQSIQTMLDDKSKGMAAQQASLDKMQGQLDEMDPQVKAAGENLYKLLTGENAKMLAPIQAQIDLQRKQMMSNLSANMGPGFMSSTAGLQAMTNFDIQSSSFIAQTQFQALNQAVSSYGSLKGQQVQGQNAYTLGVGGMNQLAQSINQMVLQGHQYGAARATGAAEFGATLTQNAQQQKTAAAAGQYSGEAFRGSAKAQTAGQIAGFVTSAGGMTSMFGGTPYKGDTKVQNDVPLSGGGSNSFDNYAPGSSSPGPWAPKEGGLMSDFGGSGGSGGFKGSMLA